MSKLLLVFVIAAFFMFTVTAQDDLVESARELAASGAYEAAIALYDQHLTDNPNDAEVWAFRGLAQAGLGNDDLALADLNTALTLTDDDLLPRLLVLRAEIHIRNHDIEAALADYDMAIVLNPTYTLAWYNRGTVFDTLGDLDGALADYSQVIELMPDEVNVYLRRARLYTLQNDPQAALDDYSAAIALQPEAPEPYLLRGHIHIAEENTQAAAADYVDWLYHIETRRQTHAAIVGSRNRRLRMRLGQLHELPFAGLAGQGLTVTANSRSVDSMLVLLGPDGAPLVADDDGGAGLNAVIRNFTLPENGDYTLIVGHARGGWDGVVVLSFALSVLV